jgi:diguanylate cyclase (GGDEF)-like protein
MRNVDVCFRYGGDEFVVVLPQTTSSAGAKAANRLLVALRARRFLSADAITLRLSASLGVASYPADATTAAELLDCADRRMYLIKNSTRDDIATKG